MSKAYAVMIRVTSKHRNEGEDDKSDNQDDFARRKVEFCFSEDSDREHVENEENHEAKRHPNRRRRIRKPAESKFQWQGSKEGSCLPVLP